MREKMRAGPGCEDLKVRSPYFYTVAAALHPVTESDTLASFVNTSFRARYQVSHTAGAVAAAAAAAVVNGYYLIGVLAHVE